jgi:hypothetical protein
VAASNNAGASPATGGPSALSDAEAIGLQVVALLVVGAVLIGLADTPLYPLAIGMLVIALFYVLVQGGGSQALATLSGLMNKLGGG